MHNLPEPLHAQLHHARIRPLLARIYREIAENLAVSQHIIRNIGDDDGSKTGNNEGQITPARA